MIQKNIPGQERVTDQEFESRKYILDLLNSDTFSRKDLLLNLGLFIEPRLMSRLLFLNFIYQKILPVQGIIMDLGTYLGHNAVVFSTLRSIYEPYNYQRKIVAFDTFAGFAGVDQEFDGRLLRNGNAGMPVPHPPNYDSVLGELLTAHEQLHPLSNIKKHDVVVGDITTTVPEYIKQHPETIISLAFFDLPAYKPTYETLKNIEKRLTIGSILVFDELNDDRVPGETLAVLDAIGLRNVAIQRFPYASRVSYVEIK